MPYAEPAAPTARRLRLDAHLDLIVLKLGRIEQSLIELERRFDPNQPRVPAGQSGGGQWSGGGGGSARPQAFRNPRREAARRAVEAALAFYAGLTASNRAGRQVVASFNAAEYAPGQADTLTVERVRALNRDDVDRACPRFGEVERYTKDAARIIDVTRPGLSAQQRGTAIHEHIKRTINGLNNGDFRAEMSVLKSEGARYGREGSIRIDVFERVGDGTTCIYDIETGDRGLPLARMAELASAARAIYPDTRRIVVTKVRAEP